MRGFTADAIGKWAKASLSPGSSAMDWVALPPCPSLAAHIQWRLERVNRKTGLQLP